jgi:hypothetical protein
MSQHPYRTPTPVPPKPPERPTGTSVQALVDLGNYWAMFFRLAAPNVSPEAAKRLRKWMDHLPSDAPDDVFNDALDRWEKGEDPPPPPPSVLAARATWTFLPAECSTRYLKGLLSERYDGMNGPLTPEEREQAREELAKRKARKKG